MSRDRTLTDPEKIAASAAFKAAMQSCGKTQTRIAEEAAALLPDKEDSFSQGAVWQWANSRMAINAERAVAVAKVVGAKPEEISVAYRRLAKHIEMSQLQRLDAAIILRTVELVHKLQKPYAGPDEDPALFAEMLRLAIMEKSEVGDGERGVWQTGRQGGGPSGSASGAEDGQEGTSAPSRRRKSA